MEPSSELQDLLKNLGAEGSEEGTGDFTLDPRRALQLLQEQGSVSCNAPLFLFRAIYEHTRGETVVWKRGLFDSSISWPQSLGQLPAGPYRFLAQGAFEASSIKLHFHPDRVQLRTTNALGVSLGEGFNETFQAAETRLRHYPVEGLYTRTDRSQAWQSYDFSEGRLEFRLIKFEPQAIHWVVCGIEFSEYCHYPLNITIKDDSLACDLALTMVRDSRRKREWLERVRLALQGSLEKSFLAQDEVLLDSSQLYPELEIALEFLPYIISLPEQNALRVAALKSVFFRDVFGKFWNLEGLLESQSEHEGLYVVPAVPKECPERASGERPVLLWDGETKKFGETLFRKLQSGAGYLYSLYRGQSTGSLGGRKEEQFLSTVDWDRGTLALKPFGPLDSRCEIKLVGKRRASETIFLDPPVPHRLNLVWRSRDEVASWDESAEFLSEFAKQVVVLVDEAYEQLQPEPVWLLELIDWAVDDGEKSMKLNHIDSARIFPTIDGDLVSIQDLRESFAGGSAVPVLEERSASVPDSLPLPLILWDHPILNRLGFQTEEVSSAVRKAYWKEEGRKKWLERFTPQDLLKWEMLAGSEIEELPGGHLLTRAKESTQLPRLVVWREGRPLGFRTLEPELLPPGSLLVYRDDDFPADQYWSGPEPSAIDELKDWIEEVKLRPTSCPTDS